MVVILLNESSGTQKMYRSLDLDDNLSMRSCRGSSKLHLTCIDLWFILYFKPDYRKEHKRVIIINQNRNDAHLGLFIF